MQKIEVIVRITKGHCPPQEQTIFEWIEMNRAAPDTLNYPGLEINLEHRRVFKNGQEVYMSRYEYGVLSLMARHPGQLFTKEQIFEAVWHQDSESCLTAVTNTIGRIRQKIEDDRAAPVYIRTISNLGYQFMPNISVKKDSIVSFLRKERYNIIIPVILSYRADFYISRSSYKKNGNSPGRFYAPSDHSCRLWR